MFSSQRKFLVKENKCKNTNKSRQIQESSIWTVLKVCGQHEVEAPRQWQLSVHDDVREGFTEAATLGCPSYQVGDHQVGSERGGKKCGQRRKEHSTSGEVLATPHLWLELRMWTASRWETNLGLGWLPDFWPIYSCIDGNRDREHKRIFYNKKLSFIRFTSLDIPYAHTHNLFIPKVDASSGQGYLGILLIFLVFSQQVPKIGYQLPSASFIPLDS